MTAQMSRVDWRGEALMELIREATPEALWEAGETVLKAAEAKAPRGATGDLKASGYISTKARSNYQKKKTRRKEVRPKKDNEMIVGFSAFYALFNEIGTEKMSAKPFLRPAFDENRGQLGLQIANKIKSKVNK